MVGMRDVQVVYPKPEIKKKTAAPIRYCAGVRFGVACASTGLIRQLKYGLKLKAKSKKTKACYDFKKYEGFRLFLFRFVLWSFCFKLTFALLINMIKNTGINNFLKLDSSIPVVDVRTQAEFAQGHICGAHNIPLFSNEERVQVGTTYKQAGREEAILLGFDLTGSKWSGFINRRLTLPPIKK